MNKIKINTIEELKEHVESEFNVIRFPLYVAGIIALIVAILYGMIYIVIFCSLTCLLITFSFYFRNKNIELNQEIYFIEYGDSFFASASIIIMILITFIFGFINVDNIIFEQAEYFFKNYTYQLDGNKFNDYYNIENPEKVVGKVLFLYNMINFSFVIFTFYLSKFLIIYYFYHFLSIRDSRKYERYLLVFLFFLFALYFFYSEVVLGSDGQMKDVRWNLYENLNSGYSYVYGIFPLACGLSIGLMLAMLGVSAFFYNKVSK